MHLQKTTFLNLAIFNLPLAGPGGAGLVVADSYEGDLSLYREFIHPKGWNRGETRKFLGQEFKRHPQITPIIQRFPSSSPQITPPSFARLGNENQSTSQS